jgi:hypothetical protein
MADAQSADNAVEVLRDVPTVMAWLRQKYSKSVVWLEADATAMDSAVGAVARRDEDEDEDVSSLAVATYVAGARSRARTKSTALKEVTRMYSTKLGHISTTFGAWGVFRDNLMSCRPTTANSARARWASSTLFMRTGRCRARSQSPICTSS